MVCPRCGTQNPDGFAFCGACGSLIAEPAQGVEERKTVTVLFCDLVGFTSRSDGADPEDVRATIRPFHAMLRTTIESFGGTVEKFIGDAVMAVFGAPAAHEDDPERAIRAGLRILERLEDDTERNEAGLSVRIGINTGEAVVSLGARPEEGEGIVTGDVVNTAARLQTGAPVDGIAVGEVTYRATEPIFEFEELEPVVAKGKSEPVAAWRPLAARARFGTDITRSHGAELVGRDHERLLLQSVFERSVHDRSVQLVTLVGEPGVGKSRMVHELASYCDDRQDLISWRQGRCLPFGDSIAFWALGEIVKAEAGILESDPPEVAAEKLGRAAGSFAADAGEREWLRARLSPLVGAERGAEADREESFAAWRRFLENIAAHDPAVFVIEDLHWADDALLGFLEFAAEWSEGVPMLLLCTARPELFEQHPSWGGGKRNVTTINLSPLSEAETAKLIGALLGRTVLPVEVLQPILERAGGNPLYAEEFVRMLRDRGLLTEQGASMTLGRETEIPLPEGVAGLVAARLDTLSPDAKSLLQDAAVVGKVFWQGALAAMADRDESTLPAALHELSRKEFIRPARLSSMEGEHEFSFLHMLVRDVAYAQLPRTVRADKHLAAAAWIEDRAGSRAADLADVLAHHYVEALEMRRAAGEEVADLLDRCVEYLALAGDRASDLDADQAVAMFERALELLPQEHPDRQWLLARWANAVRSAGRLSQALEALDTAAAQLEDAGQRRQAAQALLWLSGVKRALMGLDASLTAMRAVEVLDGLPPDQLWVDAYSEVALGHYVRNSDEEAIRWAERSIELAAELGLPESVSALGTLGGARSAAGDLRGLTDMRRAIELGHERGDVRPTLSVYNNLSLELWVHVGPRAALEVAREGISVGHARAQRDYENNARATVFEFLVGMGAFDEAQAELEELSRVEGIDGDRSVLTLLLAARVRIASIRGQLTDAADGHHAWAIARSIDEAQVLVEVCASTGPGMLATGQQAEAASCLKELVGRPEARRSWNYPIWLPPLMRFAVDLGDLDAARSLLEGFESTTAVRERGGVAARAVLIEADGDRKAAADLYLDAAARFAEGGWALEEGYARLGAGRCLTMIGDDAGTSELERAYIFFASINARAIVAEIDELRGTRSSATQELA